MKTFYNLYLLVIHVAYLPKLKILNQMKIKIYLSILVLLFIAIESNSQTRKIHRADKKFDTYKYVKAIELYKEISKRNYRGSSKNHVVSRLADGYRLTNKPQESEKWYAEVVKIDTVKPINYLYYAQALKSNGRYSDAKIWMDKYYSKKPSDSRAIRHNTKEDYVKRLMSDSNKYIVKISAINSKEADFGPTYFGDKVVFSSDRNTLKVQPKHGWTDKPYLDLFVFGVDSNNVLTNPKQFSKRINTAYHEGPTTFSSDLKTVYFTRNNFFKGQEGKSEQDVNNLKIYTSSYVDGKWRDEVCLKFNSNEYSCGHPTLSKDGKKMYFASDMPGGFGKTDIYVCTKIDSLNWTKPVNLGKIVNTEGDEMFPFMSKDGKLYFASNGHLGLGGLDLYVVEEKDGVFTKVENMCYPINTNLDDFGLIVDTLGMGYLSSNRKGGVGDDDIYHLEELVPPVAYADYILLNEDDPPIKLNIIYNDKDRNNDIDTLTVQFITKLTNSGTIDVDTVGMAKYSPAPNYNGKDQIIYKIIDQKGMSDTAIVYITVIPVNDPPIANPDYLLTYVNAVNVMKNLSDNDSDVDGDIDPPSVQIIGNPQNGSATIDSTGGIFYTPNNEFWGKDTLIYQIYDKTKASDIDTLFIVIDEINNPPVAEPDFAQANRNNPPFYMNLIKNDSDIDGNLDSNSVVILKQPISGGTAVSNGTGIDYKIGKDFLGLDMVVYQITDKRGLIDIDTAYILAPKIDTIHYNLGKSNIRADAAAKLSKVSIILKRFSQFGVEVHSHTDARGSAGGNLRLSQRRANSAINFLVRKGIKKKRLIGHGHGEEQLLNKCKDGVYCTRPEHGVNRRTTFSIRKNDK